MTTREKRIREKRFRILSLDGGGVYGLFSMLMLRRICGDSDVPRSLLENGCVDLFAGTGAGAINALILAKYDHPREGLDEAIKFWTDERLYRNSAPWTMAANLQGWLSILTSQASPQEQYDQAMRYWNDKRSLHDPWNAWMDMLGMGSWYGATDVMAVLRSHFDGLRLGDLKQNVLITAFDWGGDPDLPTSERHWKPKVYYNFPEEEKDRRCSVVDVAMSALSWMYALPVYNSEQGGEWYAPDPTMCAVVKAVNFISQKLRKPLSSKAFEEHWEDVQAEIGKLPKDWRQGERASQALRYYITSFVKDIISTLEDEVYKRLLQLAVENNKKQMIYTAFPYLSFVEDLANPEKEELEAATNCMEEDVDVLALRRLSVLSVGSGSKVPYLPVETAEWGYGTWSTGIENSELKQWIAPMQYIYFQGPKEMTREQCEWLLNEPKAPDSEKGYQRLDPQVFETPVITTMLALRNNPAYLSALLREMDHHSRSPTVYQHLKTTVEWMEAQGWFDKPRWATTPPDEPDEPDATKPPVAPDPTKPLDAPDATKPLDAPDAPGPGKEKPQHTGQE